MNRKIIHIDMDAFFASVEQRDNPDLRGKPVAVGGDSQRGVVAAASYEARKFGVRSAMPSKIAASKCPDLIFVKPRFEVYKTTSMVVRSVFKEYTDLIEPLSLDEAYLDVTHNKQNTPSATMIAQEIKDKIKERTSLTASAGISGNKFLAKIASDYNKPDGLFLIHPRDAEDFVLTLPITKFHGIGKVTTERMHKMGIFYGRELRAKTLDFLTSRFGKAGHYYYHIARAIDNREVVANRERKSIGAERTFEKDRVKLGELKKDLEWVVNILFTRIQSAKSFGKTITLKIKYYDFQQITRSKTMDTVVTEKAKLLEIGTELLNEIDLRPVRLLGLSVSSLEKKKEEPIKQLTLGF